MAGTRSNGLLRGWLDRFAGRARSPRRALVLAGGGVIGGMYEVGALAALDETLPGFRTNDFDLYVGSSAGSVVAALMANQVRPGDLYAILEESREDALNFHSGSVYQRGAVADAGRSFLRLVWAVGKNLATNFRLDWPDILARSRPDMPAGFFSVRQLEEFLRRAFAAKGLANTFADCPRRLLIPAMDLDRARRVVFGAGVFADTPISEAIAASSAIPGFFEPFRIGGCDYVDGDVGHTGHADLAVEAGARQLVIINPLVPLRGDGGGPVTRYLRGQGLYGILEQVGRINSQSLLDLGLAQLALKHPDVEVHLIQPPPGDTPLFGPSMGFEASRQALRFGRESVADWLRSEGRALREAFGSPVLGAARAGSLRG
ncbi:MAG TPA: patatin-like phospholipase family protein [Methylomirabilota bacterium]|nr:patatin-like phospholipase family protein [Methylomirabilota bacterium]